MLHLAPRTSDRNPGASRRSVRARLALPALVALTALAGSAPALATPIAAPGGPSPTFNPTGASTQGIIMRDGGICDPIRHMGC
jgi:hypothetical protein